MLNIQTVNGLDLEANQNKIAEIKAEIALLESEKENCIEKKDLACQLVESAKGLDLEESDSIATRAGTIWLLNHNRVKEIDEKLSILNKELKEYDIYSNMTYVGDFKLTGYCACRKCCGKSPSNPNYGRTAMGTMATEGRTIAMDKRFAFGTKVYIEGVGVRIVEDRGGAIKGNRIDVYCSTHQGCYNPLYNTTAKVYIINE